MNTELSLQPLQAGTLAPNFHNVSATGNKTISLADFQGKYVVMVFYPKDQTPGCTRQLCALRDDFTEFQGLNAEVIGVNPGSLESHERFVAKENYPFPILVDADRSIAQNYHAAKPEGGIQRTVYIIGPDGTILFGEQGMPTDEVLAEIIRTHV